MIKGLKICGISDPKTLKYILNHSYPPNFVGFITNYKKSKILGIDKLKIEGDKAIWKKNGLTFESEIVDLSLPRRGGKAFDTRPVIEHGITFNNKKYNIEIGLTEKDTASEMLVNRKTMTKLRVAVNPNRRYIVSDYAGQDDDYTRD